MGTGRISGTLADVLLIITLLTVLIVLVVTVLRRHITIENISNGTNRTELDNYIGQFSAEFRAAIGKNLERVRDVARTYHDKVRGSSSDRCYALILPEMGDTFLNHQDDALTSLVSSLEAGTAKSLAKQIQAVGEIVVRPRGATVTATLIRPEPSSDLLAIAVDVVSPGSRFARHHLLREPNAPKRRTTVAGRISALIDPAARCAAIELAVWVLRRPGLLASRRSRRRDGLARNMAGLLLSSSAEELPDFANAFRDFASDELEAAIDLLPDEYQPYYNLAAVKEDKGMESKRGSDDRYVFFKAAVEGYQAAEDVSDKLAEPAKGGVRRKIQVRRIHAELASGFPEFKDDAFSWLSEQSFSVEADCPTEEPGNYWLPRLSSRNVPRLALNQVTAECLYNSACMYTRAADLAGGRDYLQKRINWDDNARLLLGVALALDTGRRNLWARAGGDPSLKRFRDHIDEFSDNLRENLSCDDHKSKQITEIETLVRRAIKKTDWSPRWWSRVWHAYGNPR